jgi:hypothetical protein
MKQLNFVFAAALGAAFISVGADATTRYPNNSKRHELYHNYTGCNYAGCEKNETPKYEPIRKQTSRKSNQTVLADPFFQPAKGRFGSLSDLGYSKNTYDFEIPSVAATGDWKASEVFFKEDLSFGITDNFALMGMLKYSKSDYGINIHGLGSASMDDSGIAVWGIGGQWKFFEDDTNIDNLGIYFQSSDIANLIMAVGKFGFKMTPDTTIYGLANLSYIMWDGTSYGNGVITDGGETLYMVFENDVSKSFYLEAGAGVFTKLSDQWSFNLEAIFGSYSWHNQLYAKAGIYWQPNDMFALGLYSRASLWDSANSVKDIGVYVWCSSPDAPCYTNDSDLIPQPIGVAELSKYQDMQIGIQGMLYF